MSAAETAARIAELGRLLDGTRITSLTLSTPAETITLRRRPNAFAATAPDTASVTAPCSGVFLPRHPLRDTPLARAGQAVRAGAVLGLLRAGPLLLHVTAPRAGTVDAIVADEGTAVGYGAVLVRLVAGGEDGCRST